MPVDLLLGDGEVEVLPARPGRPWQTDASDEDSCFVRPRDNETQVEITLQDASIQTSTWQNYSSDYLEHEIAFRLSTHAFSMSTNTSTPLRQDYHKRQQYKAAGATYDGALQIWSVPLGMDLRPILMMTPEWIKNAVMLKRSILLRIMTELDQGSNFV